MPKKKKLNLSPWWLFVAYCVVYLALMLVFILNYKLVEPVSNGNNFWDTLRKEIVNFSTIIPVICPFVANFVILKISPNTAEKYRRLWAVVLALLIIVYRLGIAFEFHRFVFELIGITQFIACVAISLFFCTPSENSTGSFAKNNLLEKALGNKLSNGHILSIQLFECVSEPNGQKQDFAFRKIDNLTTKQHNDVNSIDSLYLSLPAADYGQFCASLRTYDEVVVIEGDDSQQDKLKNSINSATDALSERLKPLSLESITKADCCLARLLVCYKAFSKMISSPEVATLDLFDGELGVDTSVENALFSMVRTGLLGAVLFGDKRRYYFRYRRGNLKSGRKYCAFVVNTTQITARQAKHLVCLVTIKESSDMTIDSSVVAWIERTEEKIKNEYLKDLEAKPA